MRKTVESILAARVAAIGNGELADIQVPHGDRLVSATVTFAKERQVSYKIIKIAHVAESAVDLRESWLTPYAN